MQAETITIQVDRGITATAGYRAGQLQKPAILLLHGFLQTQYFPTIQRLAESLSEFGYTVLTPTLSLGINRRNRSLPCEAIQSHSIDQGAEELKHWFRWLQANGHQRLIAIGHSSGGIRLLALLSQSSAPVVEKLILISLTYVGQGPAAFERVEDGLRAQRLLQQRPSSLAEYALHFCRRYLALPKDFLSYYQWSRERTLAAITALPQPPYVIFGGTDQRLDALWLKQLEATNTSVTVIPGANHFFDLGHEFELSDTIESILQMNE